MINLSLMLLGRLRSRRLATFSDLLAFARKSVAGGELLFLPSINFLYLLGLVEYHPKTDSFEYVSQQ